ncbi:MAG: NAD-dependent epimerase/dehydratase family protein [Gemmatimonadaceae bacterium]|nr:NAD-dependent epimerase/dehydratase family protein [Gemmatimonadaceae bacterium]
MTALERSRLVGLYRRLGKATVDFLCGLSGVLLAIDMTGGLPTSQSAVATALLGGLIFCFANLAIGTDRAVWYFTGFVDATRLAAVTLVLGLALLALRALALVPIGAAALVLGAVLALVLAVGARVARRWHVHLTYEHRPTERATPVRARRVLAIGATPTMLALLREAQSPTLRGVEILGLLDHDASRTGTRVAGVKVLGTPTELIDIAERTRATEIVLARNGSSPEENRALMRRAEDVGLRVREVSSVHEFTDAEPTFRPGHITLTELIGDAPGESALRPLLRADAERRVLVTGGAGFVGSHLTRLLLDAGYLVRVLDSFAYGRAGLAEILDHPRLEVMRGDIVNLRDVSAAVRDVDSVIALAAIVGDPACNLDPEETVNLNYAATKVLIEACNFYGVRRLVFASSCSVYGASNTTLLDESSRLNPVSLYARTRVLSENIIFDRAGTVEPVVLRLATVFGLSPRMRFDLVVNTLTARAVVDQRISIFGGDQWRPNVHCRDAARAFMLAMQAPGSRVAGEIFNVGHENLNYKIAELGDLVASIVGDVEVVHAKDTPDRRDYRVSFRKIEERMGFRPQHSVEDGIREVAAQLRADAELRQHGSPIYHNVHALRTRVENAQMYRELVGALD